MAHCRIAKSGKTETKKQQKQKSQLLIVQGEDKGPFGPDDVDLGLSLIGRKNPLYFPVRGLLNTSYPCVECKIVQLGDITHLSGNIPPWSQTINHWWAVKLDLKYADRRPSECLGVHYIDMLYYSGPAAKDRWGIFATRGMTAAIDSIKESFFQTFQGMPEAKEHGGMIVSGYGKRRDSIYITIGPFLHSQYIYERTWPHPLVSLDFRTWTLSTRTPAAMGDKWEHRRIGFCPTEVEMIVKEAIAAFRSLLQKEKEFLAAEAKKQGAGTVS